MSTAWESWAPATQEQLIGELRESEFFSAWGEEILAELLVIGRLRQYRVGSNPIWKKGHTNSFIFICSGLVEVYLPEWDAPDEAQGQRVTIDIMSAGTVLGLSALVGKPHTAYVKAAKDTKLVWWSADDVASQMNADPRRIASALLIATKHVGRLNHELAEYRTRRSLTSRSFHQLKRLIGGDNRGHINITQAKFASLVGATPEAVCKTLKAFRKAGALAGGSDPIVVLDLEKGRHLFGD